MSGSRNTEGKCVWMDAGILTYKLCDRAFDCDRCPLDHVLRKDDKQGPAAADTEVDMPLQVPLPVPCDETIVRLLRGFTVSHLHEGLAYSTDHTWARFHDVKLAYLGITHPFSLLLPPSARIVFPAMSESVERGRPIAWIYTHTNVLPVLSPLTGTLVRQNRQLCEDPVFLRTNTYDLGWLACIVPSKHDAERPAMLPPARARIAEEAVLSTFMRRAARRLETHLAPGGICLNDGGETVSALDEAFGEAAYMELVRGVLYPRSADAEL